MLNPNLEFDQLKLRLTVENLATAPGQNGKPVDSGDGQLRDVCREVAAATFLVHDHDQNSQHALDHHQSTQGLHDQ